MNHCFLKIKARRISFALIFALLGVQASPAVSLTGKLTSKRAELETVQTKIEDVDQNLDQLQAQQQKMQQQLAVIDKQYSELSVTLKNYQQQIEDYQSQIDDTAKSIGRQQQLINEQTKSLNSQLKASYAMGQHDRLKLLLNQKDPALSSRVLVYYEYLNKMRLKKMTELNENIKQLDTLEDEYQSDKLQLTVVQKEKQAEQDTLAKLKQERGSLLARINQQVSSGKLSLNQLKEDERHLKSLIASLQQQEDINPPAKVREKSKFASDQNDLQHNNESLSDTDVLISEHESIKTETTHTPAEPVLTNSAFVSVSTNRKFSGMQGRLPWPVSGRIAKQFGSAKTDGRWNGVLISASEGKPVKAVASGKVAYSGWLRGYGMISILNHGGGFMTIYANNQGLYKHVGDSVQAGEIIASVGQSGGQSGSGLYFEIRHQGDPLDPETWCKK